MTETLPYTKSNDPAADSADMLNLLTGGWVAQTLRAVALLNIADHLADGPATAEDVAKREGSDPKTTYRLMRAAASIGLLGYEGDRRFALTGRGRLLRSDVPDSMRGMVLIQNEKAHWQAWETFPDAVREGSTQVRKALGTDIFTYFSRPENAEEAAVFARAMGSLSAVVSRGAAAAIDTTGATTVVDVGGSDGDFVLGLMEADTRLHGQVFDLPHVVDGAQREADKRSLSDRFSTVSGDFFTDEVPPADLLLLKLVLHDWNDEQAVTILRNCRSAVNESGRALVVEMVIGEIGAPDFPAVMDMNMLHISDGMERDLDEYDALFAAAGWRRAKTYPVGGGYSVMELVAA